MSEGFFVGFTVFLWAVAILLFAFGLIRAFALQIKSFLFFWFVGSLVFIFTVAWPYASGMNLSEGNDLLGSGLGKAVAGFYLVMAMGGLFGIPPLLFGILVFGFFLAVCRIVLNTLFSG